MDKTDYANYSKKRFRISQEFLGNAEPWVISLLFNELKNSNQFANIRPSYILHL